MSGSISALYQYAASSFYGCRKYLYVNENQIIITKKKESKLSDISRKIIELYSFSSEEDRNLVKESARVISIKLNNNLEKKKNRLFSFLNRKIIRELEIAIRDINVILKHHPNDPQINEGVFRLKFLATIPNHLKVTTVPSKDVHIFKWKDGSKDQAIVDEWQVIEWLSRQIFQSDSVQSLPASRRWEKYYAIMSGAYRGDHLLIEDTRDHQKAKEFEKFGAIIRASSHCETGRHIVKWKRNGHPKFGGDSHKHLLKSENPHMGITGKHIKHILFYPVDMRETKSGELICAKTARQVDCLAAARNLRSHGKKIPAKQVDVSKKHHFLALQFEHSPDCEGYNLLDAKFYKHRIYGFLTYLALKTIGVRHANVGPYGYGRTDENPVILKFKNLKQY